MITSGLVIQNHGKGIFPSSRSKSKLVARPYVDDYDSPIPTFSRPFDDKFVKTVNYRKVFGKGVTPDEKLYYLQHDAFQNMRKLNTMPLKRKTRALKKLANLDGTLMDKYLFLERFKHEGGEGGEMESIQEWIAGGMREPRISEGRQSTVQEMGVDTRSILRSTPPSLISLDELQRRALEVTRPTLATLLNDGDASVLLPQLSTFEIGPVTQSAIENIQDDEDMSMGPSEGFVTPNKPSGLLSLFQQAMKKIKPVDKSKITKKRAMIDIGRDALRQRRSAQNEDSMKIDVAEERRKQKISEDEERRKQKISEGLAINSGYGKRANEENSVSKKRLKKASIDDLKSVLGKRTSEENSGSKKRLKMAKIENVKTLLGKRTTQDDSGQERAFKKRK